MKKKLLLLFGGILILFTGFSQFQYNYYADHKHSHDVNITMINDGSNDLLIANNLFDSQSPSYVMTLKRLDAGNSVVWSKFYTGTLLSNARLFDVENYYDFIFVTGSVEDAGVRKVFIAKIEAFTGDVLDAKYFDIPGAGFNSTGLKILATASDATGDGINNDGMLVTGYISSCNSLDINCGMNAGFVLRVDLNLNVLWALEMESIVTGSSFDYDFINGAVETSDGFVLTGSATGENAIGSIQQAVLSHKIDFEGNSVWDNSYIFGNSNDISVDAFFDFSSDEIYMLANYSNTHQFAVTVFENATGNIVPAKSWNASSSNMDFYGFSIMRSLMDPDNLVITGYIREHFDGTFFNETNVFIYEFEKATGTQFGDSYQYDLYHQVATNDEYDFWNGQMPLVYYPDISLVKFDAGSTYYVTVGYRTNADEYTETELFVIGSDKRNPCDWNSLNFTTQAQSYTPINSVSVGTTPYSSNSLTFNENVMPYIEGSCTSTVYVQNDKNYKYSLYPNPASDFISLNGKDIDSYIITDSSGRMLIKSSQHSDNMVFIGELASGIYFVTLYNNYNKKETIRLIKE